MQKFSRGQAQDRRRRYLVARGSACVVCTAHSWRAFREPEERDLMSPCTLTPLYTVWAATKRHAVAIAQQRFEKGDHG